MILAKDMEFHLRLYLQNHVLFKRKWISYKKFRTNQSRYFKLSPIKAKTISFPIKGARETLKVQVKRFVIYSIHNRYEPRFLERNIAFLELALRLRTRIKKKTMNLKKKSIRRWIFIRKNPLDLDFININRLFFLIYMILRSVSKSFLFVLHIYF